MWMIIITMGVIVVLAGLVTILFIPALPLLSTVGDLLFFLLPFYFSGISLGDRPPQHTVGVPPTPV